MFEHEIDGWQFYGAVAEAEQQAVFFGDAVEAPGVVRSFPRKIANLFHPLSAPGARIEERNHAERASHGLPQALEHGGRRNHLRSRSGVSVEDEVGSSKDLLLEPVGGAPIEEIGTLVLEGGTFGEVLKAEVGDFILSLPELYLP